MKNFIRILTALAATVAAGLLLKLAAEVMGSCNHRYIEVDEQ